MKSQCIAVTQVNCNERIVDKSSRISHNTTNWVTTYGGEITEMREKLQRLCVGILWLNMVCCICWYKKIQKNTTQFQQTNTAKGRHFSHGTNTLCHSVFLYYFSQHQHTKQKNIRRYEKIQGNTGKYKTIQGNKTQFNKQIIHSSTHK